MTVKSLSAMILTVLVLGACTQPPLPEDHFYRLQVAPPARAAAPLFDGIMEVERFVATGLAAGRPIVYTRADRPNEVQAYHYHFWNEPPNILLQNSLADYLKAANAARRVVMPENRVEPDFIVTGKIRRFEQILGATTKVVAELELGLKSARSDRIIRLDNHKIEAAAADATVPAAIAAISASVSQIFGRFLSDISRK